MKYDNARAKLLELFQLGRAQDAVELKLANLAAVGDALREMKII